MLKGSELMAESDSLALPCGQGEAHAPAIDQSIFLCESQNARAHISHAAAASDHLEIALILSGRGIHRFFDHEIPCKAGDIYIIPPNVPHGFFSLESSAPLSVRFLHLQLSDWFQKAIATPGSPQYCYGVFYDDPVIAYAMLNTETRGLVESLLDNIALELSGRRAEWQDAVRAYLTLLLITIGRYVSNTIQNIPKIQIM